MARWGWALGGFVVLAALIWALWPTAPAPRPTRGAPQPTAAALTPTGAPIPLPGLRADAAQPLEVASDVAIGPPIDAGAPVLSAAPPSGGGYRLVRARGPRPHNVYVPGAALDAGAIDADAVDAAPLDAHPLDRGPGDADTADGARPTDADLLFD